MIKSLILYYLSVKPTHGYEIQKFIQVNYMDSWTKIQSGSIYYALGKLEKEGLIALAKEESVGAKVRKIYSITDKGREDLAASLHEEIDKPIYETGSDKFVIYPLLNGMDKPAIEEHIGRHMKQLEMKKKDLEKWRDIKIGEYSLKIEALCFEMMISSVEYQLKWHQELLKELDACLAYSKQMSELIRKVDFSSINNMDDIVVDFKLDEINKLKQEIIANPQEAAEKLEKLIELMQVSSNSLGN